MKTVAHFFDAAEAHLALHYLRSHDLDVSLADEHTYRATASAYVGNGGIRLLVADADAYQAKTLLDATRRRSRFPTCPECDSKQVKRLYAGGPLARAWAALTESFSYPSTKGSFECRSCGATWKETDDEPSDDV
ncbi:MAG: DUF2007 domain-containing protein [Parvularculaceae bacterium]|nr:DUF2007 domain-containing protein [Parvularculaceae bacterium]